MIYTYIDDEMHKYMITIIRILGVLQLVFYHLDTEMI